jgi:hypothetical protein
MTADENRTRDRVRVANGAFRASRGGLVRRGRADENAIGWQAKKKPGVRRA